MCSALRAYWIARGSFAQGVEWFNRFLKLDPDLSAEVRGAALVGHAQMIAATDPAAAVRDALSGLELCRQAGARLWTAGALNLLAEADLHAGDLDAAQRRLDEALQISREIPDGWNEGYALGTQARLAAMRGQLREAQRLGESALAVMRRIGQQWGVARTLTGLGSLARLRGDPGGARRCYLEALPLLREIDARPEIARCLAGIGRTALDEGEAELARGPLAESLRLSQSTGARAGVALGLECMAALAVSQGRSDLAVRLVAAASTLLHSAGFPPFPGARAERYLTPARRDLGEAAVARLWAEGTALSADQAVALALGLASGESANGPGPEGSANGPGPEGSANGPGPEGSANGPGPEGRAASTRISPAFAPPSTLTPREREIAVLVARGMTNRAIAEELVISTATVARHVGNILTRLGFQSRTQIAAWMADNDPPG
jgi:DNA-binding CsgD family transcriptional regulator